MVVVKLKGGLGNQMFQYCLFLAFKQKNIKVCLDISSYSNSTDYIHNGFELSKVFNINQNLDCILISSPFKDELKFFKTREYLGRLFFSNPNLFLKKSHFVEENYSFYYSYIFKKNNTYLDGYWQSQNYFSDFKNLVINTFEWSSISPRNLLLAKQFSNENSISMHIRRYDKLRTFKDLLYKLKLFFVFRVADKNYYNKAIEYINFNVSQPKFYIFTNNPGWVRSNFSLKNNFMLIDHNSGDNSYQDMFLMSKCKHNIISISTFSWWSAWLNQYHKKIIICPSKWALKLKKDFHTIPNDWIRL